MSNWARREGRTSGCGPSSCERWITDLREVSSERRFFPTLAQAMFRMTEIGIRWLEKRAPLQTRPFLSPQFVWILRRFCPIRLRSSKKLSVSVCIVYPNRTQEQGVANPGIGSFYYLLIGKRAELSWSKRLLNTEGGRRQVVFTCFSNTPRPSCWPLLFSSRSSFFASGEFFS